MDGAPLLGVHGERRRITDSTSITAAAERGPNNHWTCAIAAAVFLLS